MTAMPDTILKASHLSVQRAGRQLLNKVSFELQVGELLVLLGPNGAGKSTLIQAALGLARPTTGDSELWLGGQPQSLFKMAATVRARHIAYLPQSRPLAWPSRVRDVVALGRFAHGVGMKPLQGQHAGAVEQAMAACDLLKFVDRRVDTLSGGELARMHCARALATQAPILVADEPVAALDPHHQHRVMKVIRQFVNAGGSAMLVLHELDLAARYADRLLWLHAGEVEAVGAVQDTLTAERVERVFDIDPNLVLGNTVVRG